jgi:hypothetical protein
VRVGQRVRAPFRHRNRPRIEALESRELLATIDWISATSGNWNLGTNWSSGQVPGPNDDVVIDVSGSTPTVILDSGGQSIHSLTAQDPLMLSGGSLTVASQSAINGPFTVSGGTLTASGPLTVCSIMPIRT